MGLDGQRLTESARVVAACGGLLAGAVDTAGPDTRGWHWGPTDTGGFAALGVNEVLVHTHDITRGLGVPWTPPARLCTLVIDRLFTDLPENGSPENGSPENDPPRGDPAEVLLWYTGRIALDGRPRRESWIVRAARG